MYTILICDDEELERQAIKKVIQKSCPKISTIFEASNGIEALQIYKNNKPNIFFCDIKMPGKSGLEVAKEIRQVDKEQIIVFLTAYDYFHYAKEAISLNVNEYLLKPAENSVVESLVNRLILELEERKNNQQKKQNIERKFNLLKDFFQNEILSSLLNCDNDLNYLNNFKEIFPNDSNLCITSVFDINYNSFPDFQDNESSKNLIKNRFIQLLKSELDNFEYSFFLHEQKDIFYLLAYPNTDSSDSSVQTIKNQFNDIYQNTTKKIHVNTRFILNFTENSPSKIRESLFALKENLQNAQTGLLFLSDDDTLHKILESSSNTDDLSQKKLSSRLVKLMQEIGDYIDNEYMNVISLDEAAASVNLSTFYFSKVFKQYWGRNFVDYLNEVRFKNACILLENPKLNIKEVAVKAGYSDANYFSRVFKSMAGITPSEYRNNNIK